MTVLLALLALAGCRGGAPAAAPVVHEAAVDGIVVPGPEAGALPLVVALHGLGDRPESLVRLVEGCGLPVRVAALRGPTVHGHGYSWFDVGFAEDGTARVDPDGIARAADAVAGAIARLAETNTVGEPLVTGFSQGGYLSYAVAVRHPDLVVRAVPVAGALPSALDPGPAPAGAPSIRAVHGDIDGVVPFADDAATVERLRAERWDVTLTAVPGVGHAVPAPARDVLCGALREALPAAPGAP